MNSRGCLPAIGSAGWPSATSNGPFLVSASRIINNKAGMLFYGVRGRSNAPFQGGILCVKAARRTPVQTSGGNPPPNDCSGTFSFDFNARIRNGLDQDLVPGVTVNAQYYYRDPQSPGTTGLSDALEFVICH